VKLKPEGFTFIAHLITRDTVETESTNLYFPALQTKERRSENR